MLTRARRKVLGSLGQREDRIREGIYLLEGPRSIGEALLADAPVREILLTHALAEAAAGQDLAQAATDRGVTVIQISENDCRLISDTRTPQGAIAVIARSDPSGSILDGNGLILALDHVSDPGNVGTLVRAADAFSCRAVVAGPGTADFENPKVLRAAMGSNFHLPVVTVADLPETLGRLAENGAGVFAATLSGADAYKAGESVGRRVCLVLGNEARGVSPAVLAAVSEEVTVPCPGRAESLNVAMAGTVLLSIFTRASGGSR
jgi:TrmH family RNA methyltransferase